MANVTSAKKIASWYVLAATVCGASLAFADPAPNEIHVRLPVGVVANALVMADGSVTVRAVNELHFVSPDGAIRATSQLGGGNGSSDEMDIGPFLLSNGKIWAQNVEVDGAGNKYRNLQGPSSHLGWDTTGVEVDEQKILLSRFDELNRGYLLLVDSKGKITQETRLNHRVTSGLVRLKSGKVLFGQRYALGEYDPKTGTARTISTFRVADSIKARPLELPNGDLVVCDGADGYEYQGKIRILDSRYRVKKEFAISGITSTPVYSNGKVFVATGDLDTPEGGRVFVISENGTSIEEVVLDESESGPYGLSHRVVADLTALSDGTILVPAYYGSLFRIQLRNGKYRSEKIKVFSEQDRLLSAAFELRDGRVGIGSASGDLWFFDLPKGLMCNGPSGGLLVGETCMTLRGFAFERVQNGWLDKTTHLIWHDEIKSGINQYDAEANCKKMGQRLPTGYPDYWNGLYGLPSADSEFTTAEKHGFRQIFNERDQWFWSSTVQPRDGDGMFAFLFESGNGRFCEYCGRDDHGKGYSTRCVSEPLSPEL